MKIKLSILILFACFQLQAQSSGYLGKHTLIEADGLGNMPLFAMLFDRGQTYYKKSGNKSLTQSRNLLDFGWRVSLTRVSRRNVGFAFEFGYDYQNATFDYYHNDVIVHDTSTGWDETVQFNYEMLDISTINFMPKLIFTNKGGLVPVGFAHEIGIGYSSSKVVEKDYNIQGIQNASLLTDSVRTYINNNYVDYDYRYSGVNFMYGMKMRIPVSKRILLNYGLRYTLHLRNIFADSNHSGTTIISNNELQGKIGRTRIYNFISLNLGVALAI